MLISVMFFDYFVTFQSLPDTRSKQMKLFSNLFSSENFPFPIHSIHIMHKGKLLQEEYFAPYEKGQMHRMFSITKSFTSLAIGALIAEGKIELSDPICKFFPEYVPSDASPFLTEMTVQDLLMMRTCHKATTYKINAAAHWVQSFFTTIPDHAPGMIFKYDTSAAHTLAALVKKISGKGVLDYLRDVFLDDIGFSKDAYILEDPFGCEIGGSGMVAYPEDLLAVGTFLLSLINGSFENGYSEGTGQNDIDHKNANTFHGFGKDNSEIVDNKYDKAFFERYAAYVKDAISFHSPTLHEAKTIDEMQGYGYQFWMIRDNGIMMYGMGGQYMVLYPDAELIFITTADTQSVQGGTQYILDEIRRVALSVSPEIQISSDVEHDNLVSCQNCINNDHDCSLDSPENTYVSDHENIQAYPQQIANYFGNYRILPNTKEFNELIITADELILKTEDKNFVFPYGLQEPRGAKENMYGQQIYTKAFPQPDGSLYINTQILDAYVGSIHFMLNKKDNRITLSLRKVEESLYNEFSCFLDGVAC